MHVLVGIHFGKQPDRCPGDRLAGLAADYPRGRSRVTKLPDDRFTGAKLHVPLAVILKPGSLNGKLIGAIASVGKDDRPILAGGPVLVGVRSMHREAALHLDLGKRAALLIDKP